MHIGQFFPQLFKEFSAGLKAKRTYDGIDGIAIVLFCLTCFVLNNNPGPGHFFYDTIAHHLDIILMPSSASLESSTHFV